MPNNAVALATLIFAATAGIGRWLGATRISGIGDGCKETIEGEGNG